MRPAQATRPKLTLPEGAVLQSLRRRMMERRAVEAVAWGMPAVNFDLMAQAMAQAKGDFNQIVYWSKLPSSKNQTLTPNPDIIYLMPFYDTKNGPMVLEIPPAEGGSITGSIDDCWQTALEDVGPAGVDKGKGGKYLILPPTYREKAPEGYIPLRSSTFRGFALLRSNLESGDEAGIAKAAEYGKRVKFYPLAQAADPPETKFVDAIDQMFDATIRYDHHFFQSLNRIVQNEPWLDRDRAMIDPLKCLGIEKGKHFKPDPRAQEVLNEGAREAHAWLDAEYECVFAQTYAPGARWTLPASKEVLDGLQSNFGNRDSYPIDARGIMYSMAFFSTKHMGAGQFYLMTIKDKSGNPLDGAGVYRLPVPANPPVKLYWSAVAYDRATHALIRDMPWFSRSSNTMGLQKNLDGSVDVYFGAGAPAGKESNWIPTSATGKFEVLFRFYGPEPALFDKTWQLPDIERIG